MKIYRIEVCELFDFYPTELQTINCLFTETELDNHKDFMHKNS